MSEKIKQLQHPFYEETLETKPIFQGRMISLQVDTVRLPNGETATREIVRHPGAVAVVALLGDKMLVVEQFRKPLEKVQVEIPAGKLDAGEEPEAAALRELEEETGTGRGVSSICSRSQRRRGLRKKSSIYISRMIWRRARFILMMRSF